jgi:dUTP pyrophosphatase
MQKIAKFEKVSFEQFRKDWVRFDAEACEEDVKKIYDEIRLPVRATRG